MEDLGAGRDRRTVTPAIVASAIFLAACALFAMAFVGARGGLEMPVAATQPPVAAASAEPVESSAPPATPEHPAPTPPPAGTTTTPATSEPSAEPTVVPTAAPTARATAPPLFAVPTLEPGDPLHGLPACEARPACRRYIVARGDTLSGIISRYLLDIDVLEALNPGRLSDPRLIVTGQLLYLGRDPLARLDPCPDGDRCVLYVVQPGDSIAEIAARYLLSTDAVLDANPGLPRPIQAGQVIRLPGGSPPF